VHILNCICSHVETQINNYMCIRYKRLKISFTRNTSKDADNLKLKAEEVYFLGTSHYLGITNKLSIESGQI
jgi:hypothetical protein